MKTSQKSPQSVLVLSQLFYPEMISTGQTLTELCEVLVEIGLDVKVLCAPPSIVKSTRVPRRLVYKGIHIERVWGTQFPKLSFLGKLLNQSTYFCSLFVRLLFDFSPRPRLVLTNPPFLGILCVLQNKIKKRPFIYVVFDVYPDTAVHLGILKQGGLLERQWNWWNRLILKNASAVIVLGRCMKKVILEKGEKIRSLPAKTRSIHIWSDDRIIHPIPPESNLLVKKWRLEDRFVIGYLGNMGRFHDMESIMFAAEQLRGQDRIMFLFVGEGYKKRWMEEYAAKTDLRNCRFRTYVPRTQLNDALNCSQIGMVSLAPGQEGLSVPSKTFGIMAAGRPVIAVVPSSSEIAYIVQEQNCGIVVEPGHPEALVSSILKLYSDKELYRTFSENARASIRSHFNLESAAQAYAAIIASLQPGEKN